MVLISTVNFWYFTFRDSLENCIQLEFHPFTYLIYFLKIFFSLVIYYSVLKSYPQLIHTEDDDEVDEDDDDRNDNNDRCLTMYQTRGNFLFQEGKNTYLVSQL